MTRVIRFFDKTTEELAGEIELTDIDVVKLQKLFGVSADNPMYDCFEINSSMVPYFRQMHQLDLKLDKFDYFLEFDG